MRVGVATLLLDTLAALSGALAGLKGLFVLVPKAAKAHKNAQARGRRGLGHAQARDPYQEHSILSSLILYSIVFCFMRSMMRFKCRRDRVVLRPILNFVQLQTPPASFSELFHSSIELFKHDLSSIGSSHGATFSHRQAGVRSGRRTRLHTRAPRGRRTRTRDQALPRSERSTTLNYTTHLLSCRALRLCNHAEREKTRE